MEKIQEIFRLAVEYCKNEPFHAGILVGIGALALFAVLGLIAKNKMHKTAKKAAKAVEVVPVEVPQEEIKEEPIAEEVSPNPIEKEVESVPAPVLEEEIVAEEVKAEEPPALEEEKPTLPEESKETNTELASHKESETEQAAKYSGKWVIFRIVTEDKSDEEETYFFELRASNGEKLLSSEEYTTYNGAIRGIQTHKTNILKNNFRITLSKKGDYIFKLLSGKGMLLCMGEHYTTRARCESAIESTKRFAKTAFVDEIVQDQVVKVPVEDDEATPIFGSFNGKWVIDCHISDEGEKVFFFELFANNGERLLSSEEYSSYIGAVNGIQTHKANIEKGNFRISLTKHGDYIYKLLNGNGQLLCLGEHYKTKTRCKNAVESVKRFAMNSPILTDPELAK
ncbi:MAG: DUF1508 domain-containing protein [Clostridia bacterium]|nr:DUF1508 domain-containing protein [Clostridia bacterium]